MENHYEKRTGNIIVCENTHGEWCVKDINDNVIVPFGKYTWIDNFDSGLARVHTGNYADILLHKGTVKWGIINEKGEEVLPVEYDDIWNFKNKNRTSTKVIKNGEFHIVYFKDLNGYKCDSSNCSDNISERNDYDTHYGEFAGSYAQDVEGYSDDVINDAFEGDPDNYWNID